MTREEREAVQKILAYADDGNWRPGSSMDSAFAIVSAMLDAPEPEIEKVRAEEREACARIAQERAHTWANRALRIVSTGCDEIAEFAVNRAGSDAAREIEAAIRARGKETI